MLPENGLLVWWMGLPKPLLELLLPRLELLPAILQLHELLLLPTAVHLQLRRDTRLQLLLGLSLTAGCRAQESDASDGLLNRPCNQACSAENSAFQAKPGELRMRPPGFLRFAVCLLSGSDTSFVVLRPLNPGACHATRQ